MHQTVCLLFFIALLALCATSATAAGSTHPKFRVLVLYENGGHHLAYSQRARRWLDQLAANSDFGVDYVQNTDSLDNALLSRYSLFIQLDYPPYGW